MAYKLSSYVSRLRLNVTLQHPAAHTVFSPILLNSYEEAWRFVMTMRHVVYAVDSYRIEVSKGMRGEAKGRRGLILAFKLSFTFRTLLSYANATLSTLSKTRDPEGSKDWFELADLWQRRGEGCLGLGSDEIDRAEECAELGHHMIKVLRDEESGTRTLLLEEGEQSWEIKRASLIEALRRGEGRGKDVANDLIGEDGA